MSDCMEPSALASILESDDNRLFQKLLIIDCRKFIDYNNAHIRNSVNFGCSKLIWRRLADGKISVVDFLYQKLSGCDLVNAEPCHLDVVLYDSSSTSITTGNANSLMLRVPPPRNNVMTSSHKRNHQTHPLINVTSAVAGEDIVDGACLPPLPTLRKAHTVAVTNCYKPKTDRLTLKPRNSSNNGQTLDEAGFLIILVEKLIQAQFKRVAVLEGGFADFHVKFPDLCEGTTVGPMMSQSYNNEPNSPTRGAFAGMQNHGGKLSLTSLSQPCLPVSNQGPTKILPFLYLGSQHDALDRDTMQRHGIDYVLNLSITCPKADFISDEHFLRIPVNDNYSEKLTPYFERAFQFLNKVRESNACALVHCLAGISRSPTVAIAYVMTYLNMCSEEAYRYVKEKRPSISPNFNFLGQLLDYEKELVAEGRQRATDAGTQSATPRMREVLWLGPISVKQNKSVVHHNNVATTTTAASPDVVGDVSGDLVAAKLMRRSTSCPQKMPKVGADFQLIVPQRDQQRDLVPLESPLSTTNVFGKRAAAKNIDVRPVIFEEEPNNVPETAVLPLDGRKVELRNVRGRESGSGSRSTSSGVSNCTSTGSDLPSPSTELEKLTFASRLTVAERIHLQSTHPLGSTFDFGPPRDQSYRGWSGDSGIDMFEEYRLEKCALEKKRGELSEPTKLYLNGESVDCPALNTWSDEGCSSDIPSSSNEVVLPARGSVVPIRRSGSPSVKSDIVPCSSRCVLSDLSTTTTEFLHHFNEGDVALKKSLSDARLNVMSSSKSPQFVRHLTSAENPLFARGGFNCSERSMMHQPRIRSNRIRKPKQNHFIGQNRPASPKNSNSNFYNLRWSTGVGLVQRKSPPKPTHVECSTKTDCATNAVDIDQDTEQEFGSQSSLEITVS